MAWPTSSDMATIYGMEKTTLYLPEELAAALREASRRIGSSQADLVREALRLYLRHHRPDPPRSLGLGEDPHLAATDAEEWLAGEWDRG